MTWTYDDGNGNTTTQNQNVIIDDITLPIISCPGNQNVNFIAFCQFTLMDYTSLVTVSDNCNSISLTQNPTAGTAISGNTTVIITATDNGGNTSSCSFDIIPSDTSPPIASCQDITVQLDPDGTITISPIDIDSGSTDNCGIVNRTVSPNIFNCSNIGNNTITLTVSDAQGYTSNCTANVLIQDVTPPVAACGSISLTLDPITGQASISDINPLYTGSGDTCGSATLNLAQTVYGCSDIGVNQIPLTVTDPSGNSSTCNVAVTIVAPTITSGTLTGEVINPIPDNPVPPSELIEVTACPGGISEPKDVHLTLNLDASSTINASNISRWQISTNDGLTWSDVPATAGLTQYTLTGLLTTTLVRIVIQSGNCATISPLAIIRFLPPEEPPIIVSTTNLNICLTESVTVNAESYYEYSSQFGEGGFFNYAQPEDWRVDGIDGFFPASGNNADEPTWKETNGPKILSGIRYDVVDNTKFAAANGPYYTTLETPTFNTIGMTASEASLEFYQAYYFCNGGQGLIELSFDGGNTYPVTLNTDQGDNYNSPSNSGFSVTSLSNCNSSNNGQHPHTDPLQFASIDLSAYLNMAGLRVRFTFDALGTSECSNSYFPPDSGNTCSSVPTNFDVYSSWVLDNVGFPYAPIDEILEWTDEDGGVIATGSTVNVTPITPGIQDVGVTSLVNNCRADGDDGTEFVTIGTSLAYAGKDFSPLAGDCGQSSINLKAYDNSVSAVQNYNDGSWESGLYVVPNIGIGDTDYPGTGVTGQWAILNPITTGCGASATLSSITNPRATFTADPGTYTLRWTLLNGCFDDVVLTITSCNTVDFDGINDFITLKNNYSINSDFSIETWIKPHDISGIKTIFSKRIDSDTTKGYNLNTENGTVKFYWYSSTGNGSIASQYSIDTSRWYHIAVTFDGSYKLYIDGIDLGNTVVGSENAPEATASNVEALIGAIDQDNGFNNLVGNFYRGWIDELKIWNIAITQDQIRQMMNQQIYDNGAVRGEIVPLDIIGLNWSDLDGYYRMNSSCGNLSSYKGVSGRIRNMTTIQEETAPLPYTSRIDGQNWATDNTWTHFNVWDAPNSIGIDGATPIDWNIAQISHNINSGNKDIIVLGLISDTANKQLKIADPGTPQDETNDGQSLRVTHYLELDGDIHLLGESQLLQDEGSILQVTSAGELRRHQQGSTNLFNYNYWSSPVGPVNITSNNNPLSIDAILFDGTDSNNPINLQWTTAYDAIGSTTPITISNRWLYAYENYPEDTYAAWRALNETDVISAGLSFTMKGSGAGDPVADVQNYAFIGKPNNGTISTPITIGNQALIGNPYASAMDAVEFIRDNIPGGNAGTSQSIDGTLYFWEHYVSNFTHYLEDYEGGYATYNLTGGNAAVSPPLISGLGTPSKFPGRYVPVSQGFFVTASHLGGNVTFKNRQRAYAKETEGNSEFFRSSNLNLYNTQNSVDTSIQRIRLEFKTPEGAIRPLLLGFVQNNLATDAFDYGYDAENSDYGIPNDMSWMINGKAYVTQGVGDFDINKQYPIGLFLTTSGQIEIALKALENFDNPIDVFVYDSLLGTYTPINDLNYQITLEAEDYLDRFYITFNEEDTLSVIDTDLQQLVMNYLNDSDEIYINIPNYLSITKVQLINIIGQTVSTWSKEDSALKTIGTEIRIPVKPISEGTYILKVYAETQTISKKVIIKQ